MPKRGGAEKATTMGSGGVPAKATPKKARTARKTTMRYELPEVREEEEVLNVPTHEEEEEEILFIHEEEEEEVLNVFIHDMDTLQCDICFMPFESRVYACKNGHAACANCCDGMHRKCSFCGEPIGDSRCRAMEKILAGMTRPCKFTKYGCLVMVRFAEMRGHEEGCRYAPYGCPFDGCAFRGLHLYDHILEQHATGASVMDLFRRVKVTLGKGDLFRVLLHRGKRDSVFLLLNGGDVLTGRSLSMVRVCPHPGPEDPPEKFTMMVNGDDKPGSMSMVWTMQFIRRVKGFQPKMFLFVPDALWGDAGTVDIDVYV